jgi:hypothetical protein
MKINTANSLETFIKSVRAKAFEDVVKNISSDSFPSTSDGFVVMRVDDLIKYILETDSNKLKKQKAAIKDEGQVESEISFDEIRAPPHEPE